MTVMIAMIARHPAHPNRGVDSAPWVRSVLKMMTMMCASPAQRPPPARHGRMTRLVLMMIARGPVPMTAQSRAMLHLMMRMVQMVPVMPRTRWKAPMVIAVAAVAVAAAAAVIPGLMAPVVREPMTAPLLPYGVKVSKQASVPARMKTPTVIVT